MKFLTSIQGSGNAGQYRSTCRRKNKHPGLLLSRNAIGRVSKGGTTKDGRNKRNVKRERKKAISLFTSRESEETKERNRARNLRAICREGKGPGERKNERHRKGSEAVAGHPCALGGSTGQSYFHSEEAKERGLRRKEEYNEAPLP